MNKRYKTAARTKDYSILGYKKPVYKVTNFVSELGLHIIN